MSRKNARFESVAGRLVSQSGENEDVFECIGCGKPKLYRNRQTGRFICFVCGYTGKATDIDVTIKTVSQDVPHVFPIVGVPVEIRRRGYLSSALPGDLFCGTDAPGIWVPMYLMGNLVGVSGITPLGYRTLGRKGVACYAQERTHLEQFQHVHVYEGFFDWLAAIATNYGAFEANKSNMSAIRERTTDSALLFTSGSMLSSEQRLEIVQHTKPDGVIMVCFDNDIPHRTYKTVAELSWYRRTLPCNPPREYKDWDDCYHGRTGVN